MKLRCQTPNCGWAIHTNDQQLAEQLMTEHLTADPRHTMKPWTDRYGNEQCGPRQTWN